jgi:LysR family transcriptional regulator, nitrogen assimilation regulatory protein
MESRQLRYFARVVELGSLSRAAEVLHVAQPALSAHVRHLEEELGVRLLERGPRGVTPTPQGKLLAAHAASILRQFEQARQEVMTFGKELHGDVAIGIPATVSPVLIRPLLEALRERAPGIVPHVVEAMSGYLLEWLHSGRLDAAVLFSVQPGAGLRRKEIGVEEMCLVGPPSAFHAGEEVRFAELSRYPLIIPGRMQGVNMLIREQAARENVVLNVIVEVDAVSEMIGLVAQGLGYTMLARIGFFRELQAGKVSVARLVDPPLHRTLVSATPSFRPVSPATELVLELTHEILDGFIRSDAAAGARSASGRRARAASTPAPPARPAPPSRPARAKGRTR